MYGPNSQNVMRDAELYEDVFNYCCNHLEFLSSQDILQLCMMNMNLSTLRLK